MVDEDSMLCKLICVHFQRMNGILELKIVALIVVLRYSFLPLFTDYAKVFSSLTLARIA